MGGRKEKRNTLKAARRSMAMTEEEVVVQEGPCQDATCFIPAANGAALPHRVNIPHACSSFLRRKMLGTPRHLLSDTPGDRDALFLAWTCVVRKGHGRRDTLMALSDHGHPSFRRQYKMTLQSKTLPSRPILSLLSRHENDVGWSRCLVW